MRFLTMFLWMPSACTAACEKNGILEPFVYKNAIILPRQARDKQRENSKNKDAVFRTCSSAERPASAVVAARTCPRSRLVSVKNG